MNMKKSYWEVGKEVSILALPDVEREQIRKYVDEMRYTDHKERK